MKPFSQHFPDSRIGAGSEFEPHHRFVTALPNLLLNRLAEHPCRIVVDFDFRVASQTYERGARQRHPAVEFVRIPADDFVEWNE